MYPFRQQYYVMKQSDRDIMGKYRLGLIGFPIEHSESPRLFHDFDPSIVYDLIETESFEEGFEIFKKGYDAVNITAPFKEEAFLRTDFHSHICKMIGASNLLIKKREGIEAHNTDFVGVTKSILKGCDKVEGLNTLVIGCGGAGRAAAIASLSLNLETTIINRHNEKTLEFIDSLKKSGYHSPAAANFIDIKELINQNDIIIYTLPLSVDALHDIDFSGKIVIEANYRNPSLETKKSAKYIGGREWLTFQAEAAWEIIYSILYLPLNF